MGLSQNIASARRKMGFTQEQLAEKCGVSRQAVTKWECGESEPSIGKLVKVSQILRTDLTELITGKKNEESNTPVLDYRTLSAMTGVLTKDYYPFGKEGKLLILENLLEVIKTRYVNSDGKAFEKYLLENSTDEERLRYVRVLMTERTFAEDILQEYVDGKCEIDDAFERLLHEVSEQQSAEMKIKDTKDESKIAEVYHKICRNLHIMQEYDVYSEKKQNEVTEELNNIIGELSDDIPIQNFLQMYLNVIQKVWDSRDKEMLNLLSECFQELKGFVWNRIEI